MSKFFIDPIMGKIDGYSSKAEFDVALEKWKYQEVKVEEGWITGHDGKPGIPYWAVYDDKDRLIEGTYWLIRRLKGEPTGPEFTAR